MKYADSGVNIDAATRALAGRRAATRKMSGPKGWSVAPGLGAPGLGRTHFVMGSCVGNTGLTSQTGRVFRVFAAVKPTGRSSPGNRVRPPRGES